MKKNIYKPYVYKRAEDLGIPIVEGKNRTLVTVTDSDVVNAKKANSKHCALARASLRLPGVVAAYFFRKTAFLEFKDQMVRYLLPGSVQKEIVSFDRAQIFASGIYQLTPPPPSSTLAGKTKDNKRRRRKAKAAERKRGLADAIAKISSQEQSTPSTPEQRAFDATVGKPAKSVSKHIGDRTVSGIKRADAPEPLPSRSPTRYVHRTQYVRDLREPA